MTRLYLDAAPVVYVVERVSGFAEAVDARLSNSDVVLIASELTRFECRIRPLRDSNARLLQDYEEFFSEAVESIVELARPVLDRAAEIRARHKLSAPDAIHLAAALQAKCDQFLTNDHRLAKFDEIAVEIL